MPRFFLTIEYDGGHFVGWQRQENGESVQAVLEDAAAALLGKREEVAVTGAGRTDAGVHALGQVAHCDLPDHFTAQRLPLALNAHLPQTVRVIAAREVDNDAHSRFDATIRVYHYRILNRPIASALLRDYAWHLSREINITAMNEAAKRLIGKHDFTSFRARACQASNPVRTLERIDVTAEGEVIIITAEARSFLHHQVRNIVGSLILVGEGKWSADDLSAVLEMKDRAAAGMTAPPHGLYLARVSYPFD